MSRLLIIDTNVLVAELLTSDAAGVSHRMMPPMPHLIQAKLMNVA